MTGETVQLLTRTQTGTDSHGNPTWTHVETTVDHVAVAPRAGKEQGEDRVIIGLTVYLPPGTVVDPTARMRVRGDLYAVVGEPGVWNSPYTGRAHGVEVALERVEG